MMSKGSRREERGSDARTSRIMDRSVTSSMRLKIEVERLLPEISDEIVLDQVVPRLPWGTLHMMSSVNRRWRQATQRREIYDARVRSHSTDTVVVINYRVIGEGDSKAVSLYSVRDNSWYELPQFPKSQTSQRAVSGSYQCASLDGNIYVLGGLNNCPDDKKFFFPNRDDGYHRDGVKACSEVYVLDLAGRREWKQCTNMPEPRYAFGCGVMDGKIYVFGGRTSGGKYIRESVVYDPIEDSWSSIMPMQKERSHSHVVATGERLFVQGGERHDYHFLSYGGGTSEIYHPGKDKFELCPLFDSPYYERSKLFMAQGKFHKMTSTAIYVCSIDSVGNDFWTPLHTFGSVSLADTHREYLDVYDVCAIQVVNGELLVLTWYDGLIRQKEFLRSKGFGSEKGKILWETVPSGILKKQQDPHFLCSIEL